METVVRSDQNQNRPRVVRKLKPTTNYGEKLEFMLDKLGFTNGEPSAQEPFVYKIVNDDDLFYAEFYNRHGLRFRVTFAKSYDKIKMMRVSCVETIIENGEEIDESTSPITITALTLPMYVGMAELKTFDDVPSF